MAQGEHGPCARKLDYELDCDSAAQLTGTYRKLIQLTRQYVKMWQLELHRYDFFTECAEYDYLSFWTHQSRHLEICPLHVFPWSLHLNCSVFSTGVLLVFWFPTTGFTGIQTQVSLNRHVHTCTYLNGWSKNVSNQNCDQSVRFWKTVCPMSSSAWFFSCFPTVSHMSTCHFVHAGPSGRVMLSAGWPWGSWFFLLSMEGMT